MKNLRLTIFSLAMVLATANIAAQQFSPERTGGVYMAYPERQVQPIDVPQGFEVFYISHYGRHGSRWLPSQERYDWTIAQFADKANLTPTGRKMQKLLDGIVKNAHGNAGLLTPLGADQHRGIARRMAQRFSPAFAGDDAKITARSSTVERCRQSMLAFCGELRKQFPQLGFDTETDARHMAYINHESAELKVLSKRTQRQPNISTDRFLSQFFKDIKKVENPTRLLYELHTIASDMQDIPMKTNLWPYFTHEEMLAVHDANNERMTIVNGLTPLNNGIAARTSTALWQNIEQEADAIIATGDHGASLRFGHDTALYRLLTLLQLSLPGTDMEDFLPMAANLQMAFCRNNAGEVLVAFYLNEEQQKLPISPKKGCFYSWTDVKDYMADRLHRLEHLRQLASLNTMVGTAPANTRTAGMFGKGSEEHGQTLPAVLVPNGQTFWTPQTRDTEKKCVAPYYYTDTLFQGLRASHWLVGGCTQDYGSFTIATLSGERRLKPEARATRFSHDAETSHPYYYSVQLPDEQLFTELTALSHTAIVRVTPLKDGPVHIVVNTNSDEREGGAVLFRDSHTIYAHNPVHRIYQGWGEKAGFSGHLVVKYADEISDYCTFEQGVCLTFNGRKGRPIELRMATSFTSREGAERNLCTDLTFEQIMQRGIDAWTARLHTIDVADTDTARIDQFYGALYRASFLPREMSDADGAYPRFADGKTMAATGMRHYGDFSMWDTYRALHPLYNIIVPREAGEMMQSIVTMYDEGGWLPIFPCWNSYTAAMIGDHCASVLADACVKGIAGVDYERAYEAVRKNAMESPKTAEEYKNGMGRRALASYLKYGYIPLEDSVMEAFHTKEQTSRTLEYAYDDFCAAQLARAVGKTADSELLMRRSENWRNVINPLTGYADGRHADGQWEGNTDVEHRKPYITEGATCHYTWYVPQNVDGLIDILGGKTAFSSKLDSMFMPLPVSNGSTTRTRYWHGNEPCHQVAWLYALAGQPEKTRQWVRHILETEYNDTPGGLSGNDDAGQMSAWQLFAMMGFYPVCPATPEYVVGEPAFSRITINSAGAAPFVIERTDEAVNTVRYNGKALSKPVISHSMLRSGGRLTFGKQ